MEELMPPPATSEFIEPMESITDELLSTLFGWVPPIELLRSTVRVNKRFASVIATDAFWRCHPLAPSSLSLTTHQVQRCCLYAAYGVAESPQRSQVPALLEAGSVLPLRTEATSLKRDGFRVCAASSTDHVREAIEYVLSDGQPVSDLTDEDYAWMMSRNRLFWWSSRPTLSQESIETLLFTTKCPLALISQVKVKPLRDPYLLRQGEDAVSYTWSKTVITAYRLPIELLAFPDAPPILSGFPCLFQTRASTEDPGIRALPHQLAAQLMVFDDGPAAPPDQCSIDRLLEGQTPVYESTEYDVPPASNATMTFDLPPGVVANVVTLTLIGKNNEQRTGIGFYACVERVDCLGIPLYTSVHQPSEVALARAAV